MKKFYLVPLFLLPLFFAVTGQTLLTSELLGSKTLQQLINEFANPLFLNGVKYYKITYTTPDVQGNPSVASGLMVVPDNLTKSYPLLSYQHGTSSSKFDVPSNLNFESSLAMVYSGMGYVVVASDYLGLGDSPGFHPYVHAATEASTGVDALRAVRDFAIADSVSLNGRVFVTGYSQGGHSSMALHRVLEQDLANEFSVTAAAHMSGPYSVGEVMRQLLFSDEPYERPAYLVNTMFSYQYVYGNLYTSLSDVLKPEYVDMSQQFFDGEIGLGDLNDQLYDLLVANEGAPIAKKIFKDDYLAAIIADPQHPVNIALTANNTYDWTPTAATRLYYCTADEQVPYENSIVARDTMMANGAVDLVAIDANSAASHTLCVTPAVFQAIFFFQPKQGITAVVSSSTQRVYGSLSVAPNPTSGQFTVKHLPGDGLLSVLRMDGGLVLQQEVSAGDATLAPVLENGLYLLEFRGKAGLYREKLLVLR